jgi:beta-lactamase class A
VRREAFIATGLCALAASAVPKRAGAVALGRRVAEIVSQDPPGIFGLIARTMAGGQPLYAINAFDRFPCASTIKVLVMTTAFYAEERWPGALRERITFRESSLIGGSDYMQNVSDGTRMTVAQLMEPMILVSDNTAANLLIRHFGTALINQVGRRAGMRDTLLARTFVDYFVHVEHELNRTTPYDMARLLYLIERGAREDQRTIVDPQHCREMIGLMLRQQDRDKIPAGLPTGVAVADKDGEIDGTRNDVAIVDPFGDSPFVLSIFTKGIGDYDRCLETIHRVALTTYDAVAGSNL